MENWKQKPLSQVVSRWIRGTTLNRSRADYYTKTPGPESLPWARVGDMKKGLLCETENYLTKEGVDQIPWLIVPEGAVLLFCIRNHWKKCYCRLRSGSEPGDPGHDL